MRSTEPPEDVVDDGESYTGTPILVPPDDNIVNLAINSNDVAELTWRRNQGPDDVSWHAKNPFDKLDADDI